MICGVFHEGSGLGNQLFRYTATRVLAEDKGYEWGMTGKGLFKGDFFKNFVFGAISSKNKLLEIQSLRTSLEKNDQQSISVANMKLFFEKEVRDSSGTDIRSYDPEINFVEDNTIIDGEFQDERYFKHRLKDVRKWLSVAPLEMPDDLCVIGFRGGEYRAVPDLFLPESYWDEARHLMTRKYPGIRFEVHTDDPETARKFFPSYPIIHGIGINWRSVRYAKHLIIANSSFYILPALLNEDVQEVIAPRYWARRNTGVWALPQNFYSDSRWRYI